MSSNYSNYFKNLLMIDFENFFFFLKKGFFFFWGFKKIEQQIKKKVLGGMLNNNLLSRKKLPTNKNFKNENVKVFSSIMYMLM